MALFTSVQSGNWNDAATWDVGGGAYPGSTDATLDTAIISAGHNVTLNITTFPGTGQVGAVIVNGTVTVAANFTAFNDFYTGEWTVNSGGLVKFKNDAAGIYCLRLCRANSIRIKSGGKLEMLSTSDYAIKHTLWLDQELLSGTTSLIVESGGIVDIEGYDKIIKTNLSAQANSAQKQISVDQDTNWEVGDIIVLSSGTESEYRTLSSQVSAGVWDLNSNLTYTHLDNTIILNMTTNVTLYDNNPARPGRILIANGSICSFKKVAFNSCYFHELFDSVGVYEDLRFWSRYGPIFSINNTNNLVLKNIYTYFFETGQTIANIVGSYNTTFEGGHFINPATSNAASRFIYSYTSSIVLKNLEFTSFVGIGGYSSTYQGEFQKLEIQKCYIYDCGSYGIWIPFAHDVFISDTVFGKDSAGIVYANVNDLDIYSSYGVFDNCYFSGSTTTIAPPDIPGKTIKSINHQQTAGRREEYQIYGYLVDDATDARSGKCYKIDPSSATWPFVLRINFPCLSSKTPQLKFWAKKDNTLGNIDVCLGNNTCGLTSTKASSGSLDANRRFAPTDDYVQYTIDFNGPTTVSGEIEVEINIRDSSSGIFYIDDITVSGNLT